MRNSFDVKCRICALDFDFNHLLIEDSENINKRKELMEFLPKNFSKRSKFHKVDQLAKLHFFPSLSSSLENEMLTAVKIFDISRYFLLISKTTASAFISLFLLKGKYWRCASQI